MLAYDVHHATRNLVHAFVAWKSLLLIIAVGSGIGPAYDTSSTLIPPHTASASFSESPFDLATKLTRWDAIYFVQAARRGYVFGQEWAFGGALPVVLSTIAKATAAVGLGGRDGDPEALIAICVAHVSHLASVLALYRLGVSVGEKPRLSFVAALLHILSPAGLFLSAPYNESSFALCSFVGYLLFAQGVRKAGSITGDLAVLSSGIAGGLATTFRSNGILTGTPFAVFALRELAGLATTPTFGRVRRLVALGVGGIFIALGLIGPQAVAYQEFCSEASVGELRPWCAKRLPSIYTFVQERYWNVGFLRYWTPGDIPLFLLAAPMLYVMLVSGLEMFASPRPLGAEKRPGPTGTSPSPDMSVFVRSMAASQVILTALAITNYHVQIITRISSGYPVWYWWVARGMAEGKRSRFAGGVVVFMVMYACIQGALFASFLPPA